MIVENGTLQRAIDTLRRCGQHGMADDLNRASITEKNYQPTLRRQKAVEKLIEEGYRYENNQWVAPVQNNPAVAAIQYALANSGEDPMTFLRLWNQGDFDVIRDEWDDVPDSVFEGADPTWQK